VARLLGNESQGRNALKRPGREVSNARSVPGDGRRCGYTVFWHFMELPPVSFRHLPSALSIDCLLHCLSAQFHMPDAGLESRFVTRSTAKTCADDVIWGTNLGEAGLVCVANVGQNAASRYSSEFSCIWRETHAMG
jgi:hypothetical protein